MSLFDKKYCYMCGKEIGFFSTSIVNGITLCKICGSDISPFANKQRCKKPKQLFEHLKYRKSNKTCLDNFQITRSFGEYDIVCIDENTQKFYVKKFGSKHIENPDIIDCSSITECKLIVDEDYSEYESEKAVEKIVSIISPTYIFEYMLSLKIRINHPWIDEIIVRLNKEEIEAKVTAKRGTTPQSPRAQNNKYKEYESLANEIKDALEENRTKSKEKSNKPKNAYCTHCGAVRISLQEKICKYCDCEFDL